MSVDGKWNIKVDTPTGKTESVLDITTDGDTLTGTSTTDGNTTSLDDGRLEDGRVRFSVKIKKPLPIRLKFNVAIDDDDLNGEVKVGIFGTAAVIGNRI
jgi:hypothetical protein